MNDTSKLIANQILGMLDSMVKAGLGRVESQNDEEIVYVFDGKKYNISVKQITEAE